ncbi:protein alp1-like [Plakobranchus ocellatus]|uniref:Protein alp1-like n=1 Tax=Plakobranchus ocellatus TaxID=259542 RepID=A0AAV4BHJ9_9GAST|nr:protein alp1-like [Plakobranchus ocellatus]
MCDADYRVIPQVCNMPGSVHDARILRESDIFTDFEGPARPLDGIILGDSRYMIQQWLLTPYANPHIEAQERFNLAHASTHGIIERSFLHNRYLEKKLPLPACGDAIITSSCRRRIISVCTMLRNIVIRRGVKWPI